MLAFAPASIERPATWARRSRAFLDIAATCCAMAERCAQGHVDCTLARSSSMSRRPALNEEACEPAARWASSAMLVSTCTLLLLNRSSSFVLFAADFACGAAAQR